MKIITTKCGGFRYADGSFKSPIFSCKLKCHESMLAWMKAQDKWSKTRSQYEH